MATRPLSDAWFFLRQRLTGSRIGNAIGWFYDGKPELEWRRLRRGYKETHSTNSMKNMSWGREHEDDSVYSIEEVFGVRVYEAPFATDERYPWIGATPDGYVKSAPVDGQPFIVECKCPGRPYKSPPLYYVAQMYIQMRTYGTKRVYFACWTPKRIKIWILLWDDRFWAYMVVLLLRFWDCVVSNTVPNSMIIPDVGCATSEWADCDYSDASRHDVVKKHGIEDWMLPPRPVYTLAIECEGVYSAECACVEIKRVLHQNEGAIRSAPVVRQKTTEEIEFVDKYYENANFQASVVNLHNEALEKYKK